VVGQATYMKFVARVIGTWLIALAVVLLVIDGTKTLAANDLVMTSIGELWAGMHSQSWAAMQNFVLTALVPRSADWLAFAAFSVPAWALSGVLGIIALVLGRKRRKPVYTDPL